MLIPVAEAQEQWTHLVQRAEAGEEIVLTRLGEPVLRLVPFKPKPGPESRLALIEAVRAAARARATPGPDAARSQDFLYDDHGLPR